MEHKVTAVCLVSSPEMIRLFFHLIGPHRVQCWTDCESLPSPRRLYDSCRVRQTLRPARTNEGPDSASAPSAALCRHLTAGFPGSTEERAPQACSREVTRRVESESL